MFEVLVGDVLLVIGVHSRFGPKIHFRLFVVSIWKLYRLVRRPLVRVLGLYNIRIIDRKYWY